MRLLRVEILSGVVYPAGCSLAMNKSRVFPILLAAGSSGRLGFPKPLAPFGEKTALEIAGANCAGRASPVVVLGSDAILVRPDGPGGLRGVINPGRRSGQI